MRNLSSAFKTELENDNRVYLEYADFRLTDNTELHLTNEHLWQGGFEVEDCVSSNKFEVGTAIINKVTLIVNNIYEDFEEYDFFGATATISIGLLVNDEIEQITLGHYTVVNQPIYNGSLITIELYDNMYKFDRPYSESTLVYPASLDTIVRNACTVCGVTLITTSFPNRDFVVSERPDDEALTFREVIAYAAQISGCFARCNSEGYLTIQWFDQAALTNARTQTGVNGVHYIHSLYSKSFSTDDVVITGVKVSMDVDREETYTQDGNTYTRTVRAKEEYLAGTSGYVISIENNPLIAESQVQTVATYLGNRLNGFAFRTAEISHGSDPSIEAGDVALVTDGKGKKYPIVVSKTVFKVGDSQKTSSTAEEPIRNTSARYSAETKNYVEMRKLMAQEKTERERIEEDLVRRIDEAKGLFETQVPQMGGGVITFLHDKPLLEDSDIQIQISSVGVTVTANGTAAQPMWYGLTVDGQLIANILSTAGINADWINSGQLLIEKNGVEVFFADVDTGTVRIAGDSIQIVANDTVDTAIKTGTRSVLDNAQAYGLGLKVNYSGFDATSDGECYYHGYAATGGAADVNGWVQWNGNKVTVPKGQRINPNSTMPFGSTLYSVYRLNDQSWHDVTWVESTNTWEANTYTNSTPSARSTWTWDEKNDIILASYSIGGEEAAITDAKLFTPPKKFSELSEVASMKAKLYTDTTLSTFATTINAEIADIQDQLDGVVDTYYYSYTPTTSNIPASQWNTEALKAEHEGDLFLDTSTGKSYRWVNENNAWQWKEIPDTASAQALIAAQNAQDTADHKRRVFVAQPDPPYDIGDLWMQGSTGDILTCINTRSTGDYVSADWSKLNKYTDDTATNQLAVRVTNLEDETVAYYLNVSQAAVVKKNDGTFNPTTITLFAQAQKIAEELDSYEGFFKIETQSGSTWTTAYTSSAKESYKIYTITGSITAIRCSLYKEVGFTTLLDQQTVPIVSDGTDGERGNGTYKVTTEPTSYTTQTGGFTPSYRISLSTVKTQSGVDDVFVGDIIEYSYYHYPVGYVDASYVYLGARVSIRGEAGTDGINNATVTLYQRGATAPTKPAGTLTYTFATGVLSGTLGNWTQSIPSGTDPVWAIVATASASTDTDTIASSEWSSQVKILENGEDGQPGANGSDGYNQATVYLYQRSANAPNKPSVATTYTFSSGGLSPLPSGWSRTVPANNGDPCYMTTAAAISKNATYSIASSSWSDVVKLVEDGTDGEDGADAYTVLLSNESHTFAGSETAALAGTAQSQVITYKGTSQVSCYVGASSSSTSISTGITGLTCSISNNNSSNVTLTFTATTSLVTKSGTVTIPVHVDGKTFNVVFSFSLALKGEDGERGATWYPGTAISGTSVTPQIYPTGIANAIEGDHYLNTNTQNVYVCTLGGNSSTAKWKYEQNIRGTDGTPGSAGSNAYLHVKYSNDGGQTFTGHSGEDPGDWIGTYSDGTQADSTSVSAYTWAKIKGDDGEPGADGEDAYFLETPFSWTNNGTIAAFEAIIYKGDEIVTDDYPYSWFEWWLRNENGENRIAIGKTCTVSKSSLGYGSTITCIFQTYDNRAAKLLTRSGAALQTRSGLTLTTYIQAEGEQPITELPVKAASSILLDDKLLGIDAADGYIMSITDFASKLATGIYDSRYVNANGDTMTGQLNLSGNGRSIVIVNTSVDPGMPPSTNYYGGGLYLRDKNGSNVAVLREVFYTNGRLGFQMEVSRSVSGSNVINNFHMHIGDDGTKYVQFSDPAAWRSGMGVVNIAGDTMTGNLTIKKNVPAMTYGSNNVNSQIGYTVSSNTSVGSIYWQDTQNYSCAYTEVIKTTTDDLYRSYALRRKNASGTVITNAFYQHINASGTKTITFDNTDTRNAWRSALGGSAVPGNFSISTVNITVGVLAANGGSLYNQTTASGIDSNTYRILRIVGWELAGSRYTYCSIPKLSMSGANILWSVTNFGSSATASLTLTVHILKVTL